MRKHFNNHDAPKSNMSCRNNNYYAFVPLAILQLSCMTKYILDSLVQ